MTRRNAALRRYPALGYLAGTAALALLLPSGLTVPNSGPPTLAEYAPVPGQGEGRSDTSEIGPPTSGGLGDGGVGVGVGGNPPSPLPPDEPDVGGGGVRKPGTKRCVGNPPRQTEDPLSPPCIAYFEGDNGGATAKGVTQDEVTVAVEHRSQTRDPRDGEIVDCAAPITDEDTSSDLACKAFHRYFNSRYQTYSRTVHLWHTHGALGTSIGSAGVDERLGPFAFSTPLLLSPSTFTRHGILAVGFMGTGRKVYGDAAPRFMTFRPDVEDEMRTAASYICLQLAGRPARHSGNPLDADRERVFGVWGGTGGSAGRDDVLTKELDAQCGIEVKAFAEGDDRNGPARMQSLGVTTIIMMEGVNVSAAATHTATSMGYFPEWVVLGNSAIDGLTSNSAGRLQSPSQWQNAFGISFDYRRNAVQEQQWYRAYREGCAECPVPQAGVSSPDLPYFYDLLALMFHGIQAAGPRLTVENMDRGLHAIPPRASSDPFRPAAYFAPGNSTFIKDAMGIWWDPAGRPAGSATAGCYRLASEGRRFRFGEWPRGDESVKGAGPCQADPF